MLLNNHHTNLGNCQRLDRNEMNHVPQRFDGRYLKTPSVISQATSSTASVSTSVYTPMSLSIHDQDDSDLASCSGRTVKIKHSRRHPPRCSSTNSIIHPSTSSIRFPSTYSVRNPSADFSTRSPTTDSIREVEVPKDAKWEDYKAHIQRRSKKAVSKEPQSELKKPFSLEEYKNYVQKDARPALSPKRGALKPAHSGIIEPNQLCYATTEGGMSKLLIPIAVCTDSLESQRDQPRSSPRKKKIDNTKKTPPSYIQIQISMD